MTVKLPLAVFTSSANADGLVNTAFNYTVVATGVATNFTSGTLPAGLTLDAVTGIISGTPTIAGTSTVTITATNSTGPATTTLTIVIYSGATTAPVINSALSATGTSGSSFSSAITATGNPTSYFAIGLPAGLSCDPANGGIYGTPTVTGTFNVTIRASNRGGTGSATLTLTINPPPPVITSVLTANGIVGVAFNYAITASNSPASYDATGLPAGLSRNTMSGVISGTPSEVGVFNVSLSATNGGGTGTGTLVVTIQNTPFSQWQVARFTPSEMNDPKISGSDADPDGDGLVNWAEFALNRDPKKAAGSPCPTSIQHDSATGNDYLTMTYTRRKAPSGIVYHVEVTYDFAAWNEGAGFTQETAVGDDGNGITETVTVRALPPVAQNGKAFMRLRFTQ